MSAFWNLDKAKANKAGQSERIEGNSQITLKIISAAWVVRDAKNGSGQNYSLDLHVMNENKNKAHINIVYGNSLGERWSGENLINAIMTACNVPSLSQVQGNHEVYNFETKQDEIIQTLIAPELANKYFGAFLTENWYVKDGQPTKYGVNLFNVYDFQTNQLARQKNAGQPADLTALSAAYEDMLKASEKAKKKAYEKAGIAIGVDPSEMTNNSPFMGGHSTTYNRNPLPDDVMAGREAPKAGDMADLSDIPF